MFKRWANEFEVYFIHSCMLPGRLCNYCDHLWCYGVNSDFDIIFYLDNGCHECKILTGCDIYTCNFCVESHSFWLHILCYKLDLEWMSVPCSNQRHIGLCLGHISLWLMQDLWPRQNPACCRSHGSLVPILNPLYLPLKWWNQNTLRKLRQ